MKRTSQERQKSKVNSTESVDKENSLPTTVHEFCSRHLSVTFALGQFHHGCLLKRAATVRVFLVVQRDARRCQTDTGRKYIPTEMRTNASTC